MKMVKLGVFLVVLGGYLSYVQGQDDDNFAADPNSESGHYVFLGAKLLVRHKDEICPVVSVKEGNLYLDTTNGLKRAKQTEQCLVEAVVGISDEFVKVDDVEIDYSYGKKLEKEDFLLKEAERRKREVEFQIFTGELDGGDDDAEGNAGTIDPFSEAAEATQEAEDYEEEIEQMVIDDEFDLEGAFDTLYVKLQLTPNVDLDEVICAVVVNYVKNDAYSRFKNERGSAVRIHMLSNLMGQVPNEISFRKALGTGAYQKDSAEIEFYFFDRDGKPIASNQARGLKMLTWSQLERLQGSES